MLEKYNGQVVTLKKLEQLELSQGATMIQEIDNLDKKIDKLFRTFIIDTEDFYITVYVKRSC